jgi:hypothetical protein
MSKKTKIRKNESSLKKIFVLADQCSQMECTNKDFVIGAVLSKIHNHWLATQCWCETLKPLLKLVRFRRIR